MEYSLDVLSSLCSSNKHVSKAELIDNGQHTSLPVDAFDGQTISTPFQQLESQWQELLLSPATGNSTWPLATWQE
ncbi:hypothetical protein [Spirosoma fluviale]|nr:hypothetical protein [Spirosoma fluviale]